MMEELERAKLAAEVELLRAQIKKTDRDAKPSGVLASLSEIGKVVGAVILGLGGTMAAITGYQSAELRKEKMELDMQKIASELEKAQTLLNNTQTEYARTLTEFQTLQGQLAALKRDLDRSPSVPEPARASLERTIVQTNEATTAMEARSVTLGKNLRSMTERKLSRKNATAE
jgi:hypothetical protein